MFQLSGQKLFGTFLFVLSAPVWAQNYTLGDVTFAGTACRNEGDVVVVKSPDDATASLLFSDFSAEAGTGSAHPNRMHSAATCVARVPVTLSKKFRLQSYTVDYRGFADAERGAIANFTTGHTLWFPLRKWTPVRAANALNKIYRGPASKEIDITEKVSAPTMYSKLACGQTVYVDVGMRLDAYATARRAYTRIELNSLDMSAEPKEVKKPTFRVGFNLVRCD